MSQSPFEIVRAALRYQSPERLPVRMGSLGVDDTFWIPRHTEEKGERNGMRVDEWGCAWDHTSQKNMGQVKGHPPNSVAEYGRATIPDYNAVWRYEGIEQEFVKAEAQGKYTQMGIFMVLFERMHSLAGFVFSDYGDGEAIGAPLPAKRMMYDAFSDVSREVYGKPLPKLA